jgi:hypothetical protein
MNQCKLTHFATKRSQLQKGMAAKTVDRESITIDSGMNAIKKYDNRVWPCGISGGQTPNLMLGLAGIGYFYLRLYDNVTCLRY